MNQTKTSTSNAPIFLIMTGVLLIASVPLIRYLQNSENASNHNPSALADSDLSSISAPEAALLLEKEMAIFLDVGSLSHYQEGHIPGAVHIPADNIKSGLAVLNSDSWIVIYSSDVDGEILTKVREDLLDNGFSNVNILEGGILSWKNQGFPVTSHP